MAVFIAAAVCCVLLYFLLLLPALDGRGKSTVRMCTWYAHRGLHGDGICENSMRAFERAVKKGYGIELDVRLTRDRALIVFHDDTAERLCGVEERICDMPLSRVQNLRLSDGQQIPLFLDVLRLVQGRVPLLVELKPAQMGDTAVARKVWELLQGYPGQYAVQSFDPLQLRWFYRHAGQVTRGQLAQRSRVYDGPFLHRMVQRMAAALLFNRLSRPHYIAYEHGDMNKSLSCRLARKLYKVPFALWTVKSRQEAEQLKQCCDVIIFENFQPEQIKEEKTT